MTTAAQPAPVKTQASKVTSALPASAATPASGAEVRVSESLDQVREILFGAQVREVEKRFAAMEDRLSRAASELHDELRRRFESLEAYVRKEMESLGERLGAERQKRGEGLDAVGNELKGVAKALEKKLDDLESRGSQSQRELRDHILSQSKELGEEIRAKHQTMRAALDEAVRSLRAEKTDRVGLATLLTEVAARLTSEPPVETPGGPSGE